MKLLLKPTLKNSTEYHKYCAHIKDTILRADKEDYVNTLLNLSKSITQGFNDKLSDNELILLTAKSVTLDLVAQGWVIDTSSDAIELNLYESSPQITLDEEKIQDKEYPFISKK